MKRRGFHSMFIAWMIVLTAASSSAREPLDALVAAGRLEDAYAEVLRSDEGGRDSVTAEFARALLGVTFGSEDVRLRWLAIRTAAPLRDAEVARRAAHLARSPDRYERALAVELLSNADPRANQIALLDALNSEFRSVRLRALKGLAQLADPDLISRFATVLEQDPDPEIRALAARVLGVSNSPEAIAPLQRALGDSDPLVHVESVRSLSKLHDPHLVDVLRARLHEAAADRVPAVRLIGNTHDSRLIEDLAPLLKDGDPELRIAAAAAILAILEKHEEKR